MPLITCPDCQKSISDTAKACPHCGRPNDTEQTVFTIEGTFKHLKLQLLIGAIFIALGGIAIIIEPEAAFDFWAPGLIAFGVIWMIVVRVKIWWHHE